jgi:hypothetical protein
MISAQRVNKLLMYLCKRLPTKEVEGMKGEIEEILGFDVEKATKQRKQRRERDSITHALSMTIISDE